MKRTGVPNRDLTLAIMAGFMKQVFAVFPHDGDVTFEQILDRLNEHGEPVSAAQLRGALGKLFQARLIERSCASRWRVTKFQPSFALDGGRMTEETMNQTQFQIAMQGQTAVAKRVLEAVPMQEAWPAAKITTEYARCHGVSIERRVLDGCLTALSDSGVIRERQGRTFIRVAVKPVTVRQPADTQPDTDTTAAEEVTPMHQNTKPTPTAASAKPDAFGALAGIATKLREMADAVELAALDAEAALQAAGAESQKLADLRKLLKDI